MSLRLLKCAVSVVMLLVHSKPFDVWIRVNFPCWCFPSTLGFWLKMRFLQCGLQSTSRIQSKSLCVLSAVEKVRCRLCSCAQHKQPDTQGQLVHVDRIGV